MTINWGCNESKRGGSWGEEIEREEVKSNS